MPYVICTLLRTLTLFVVTTLVLMLMTAYTACGATYWVSKSGSTGSGCVNSSTPLTTTAKLTIAGGMACLGSGDILNVRAGTYDEQIIINNVPAGGGSFASATIIRGAPGETRPFLSWSGSGDAMIKSSASRDNWVIIDRFEIGRPQGNPHNSHGVNIQETNYVRLSNSIIHDVNENGVLSGQTGHEFLNNEIYRCGLRTGENAGHGFYAGGDHQLFDGNFVHDCNPAQAYGFHIYTTHADVHDNLMQNNRSIRNGTGMIMAFGVNNVAYNNILANNAGHGIFDAASGAVYYSNTVTGNGGCGYYQNCCGASELKNTIMYSNGGGTVCTEGGTPPTQAANVTSDPGFVSAFGGDFHIQAFGSPAVNAGVNLPAPYNIDIEQLVRPLNKFTVGAHQFAGQPPEPTPDPGDLLAEWLFDDGSGTTAADSSGHGHPCTLTSAGWVAPGIIGPSAFSLNGTRSCQVSSVTGLTTVAFALSGWLKGTVLPPSGYACLYTTGDSIQLCIDGSGRPTFTVYTNGYHTITGPTSVQNGVAHHLVASYHATDGMRLWVDGAQIPSFGAPSGIITYALGTLTQHGRYFTDNAFAYTGIWDQVRAYFGPLTQAAVTNLFNENVSAPGMSLTHMGWFAANQPEGIALGPSDSDRSHVLTTPLGMRFAIHKADTGSLTEYFRPYCRVLASPGGSLVLDWTEVTNSFGTLGVRYLADSAVTQYQATSALLPTDGFTAIPGKFLINPIATSSYPAAQRQTIAQGQHAEQEIRVEIGSPRVAGQVLQCKLRRENGVDFDSYGPGDAVIKSLLLLAVAPPTNVKIGGTQQGGTQ